MHPFATPCREFFKAKLAENQLRSLGHINGNVFEEWLGEFYERWVAGQKGKKKKQREPFEPPSPREVTEFSVSIGYPLDGEAFCLHYETKDWCTSGTTKMRNWRAAVHKWKANGWNTGAAKSAVNGSGYASLTALQMELKAVENELEAILYPGGSATKQIPQPGTPLRTKAEQLEKDRLAIKGRIRDLASGVQGHGFAPETVLPGLGISQGVQSAAQG